MYRRYSVFFSNLALVIFFFAMLASSVELALTASALAFVSWLHGILAASRVRRWGWVALMLSAGALFLLAWLQSDTEHVQLGFVHMKFNYPGDATIFLLVLPGFLLAPTVLFGLVARFRMASEGHLHPDNIVVRSAEYVSAGTRRALAVGSAHPEIFSGGLMLLLLFLIIAAGRFGGSGMRVQFFF